MTEHSICRYCRFRQHGGRPGRCKGRYTWIKAEKRHGWVCDGRRLTIVGVIRRAIGMEVDG